MTARRLARLVARLAIGALPGHAFADEPRSAIPWLSQSLEPSIDRDDRDREKPGPGAVRKTRPLASGIGTDTITVTPLGDIRRDGVGLLPSARTGLDPALWGPTPADKARGLILAHQPTGVPEARALFLRLLIAEAVPPSGAGDGTPLLLARIDRLLEMGALDEAEALMGRAGPDTPQLFRRWFDTGLLLERSEGPCAALRNNPQLSPTLPARVFCLARGGDWNAAEITLTLGQDVGVIDPGQERLLARFLDPELFEAEAPPPIPEPLTGLDFLMREAVGLPRPRGPLPLAFLHGDLSGRAPMRARILAGERLVLSGAVPPARLYEAYRAGEPAASGGVWDRAAFVQSLDAALDEGDPEAIGTALAEADAGLHARGLRLAFAQIYASAFAELDPSTLAEPATRALLAELLLLGGEVEAAVDAAGANPPPHLAAALAIADGSLPHPPVGETDDQIRAALAGMTDETPEGPRQTWFAAQLAAGRQGEVLLDALDLLAAGTSVDPSALRDAIFALRHAGQAQSATRVALQTLLLRGGG